ncbi:MAG TPA: pyruvate dehydrogenase complex dihydrolipoamide acetyltransferase [Chlamydiales bacterium]|jgi:pyruvate dehydrogenase E2 component (dihydrolipoamide acetyltransferase)|nr:pyruvate dehydrogenase complex dihydrolipoamide acetyltransferase [Chlamydiales bacterium]
MEEGVIAKWHKKTGDKVEAGDVLLEVATDKATVEYNALDEGFLRKILVANGGHAIVNQPIAVFTATATESIDQYKPEGITVSAPKPSMKQEEKEEHVAVKATSAPTSGSMQQPAFVPEAPLENYQFAFPSGVSDKRIAATPLAKKVAKEKGLDLTSVKGTGPSGRISSHDLSFAQPKATTKFGRTEAPSMAPGTYEEIPMTPMRKVIGQRLQQSKTFIPHFYVRQEIDAQPLIEAREQLKNGGLKITFNDLIVRAAALALKECPEVNSGFNSVTQSIILFKTIDISVAVTVEGGLITPIVRHADYKNVGEISVEVKELADRARQNKLQPHEYKGGSFTVSNLGMFGVSDFVAVINPPQAAILAVSGIEDCVRWKNDAAAPGKKMNFTLSADHRVIDGSLAAKFIKILQKYLENPAILLV